MSKELRELMKQLPGWTAEPTRRHTRLVHLETKSVVIASKTPGDYRSFRNTLAQCKRAVMEKK